MTGTILDKIISKKRHRLDRLQAETPLERVVADARTTRRRMRPHAFRTALGPLTAPNIIAEIKRASPSKGVINDQIDVAAVARGYAMHGAAAISVLTEEDFFRGSLDDLRSVKAAIGLPVLRKDFIIDEYQIYESAAAGADAVLLIVAALTEVELTKFRSIADDELHMDAIVEVHSPAELEIATRIGATIIGVNNRDLKTFDVSLDVCRRIIVNRAPGTLMIAESGLSSRSEIDELRLLGFDGFLIGETLMREPRALSSLAGGSA